MPILFLAIYLCIIIACGYALLCLLAPGRRVNWFELAGTSFAAGSGLVAIALFLFSLCGRPPNRVVVLVIALFAVAAILVITLRNRHLSIECESFPTKFDASSILALLAWLLIGLTILQIAIYASMGVVGYIDEYAIWMFRAKVLAGESLIPIPRALLDPALTYSQQDYPPGFPLLISGVFGATGMMSAALSKSLLVAISLSTCCMIYSALRRMLRSAFAVAITALVIAAPVFRENASLAIADNWFVLQSACAVIFLLRWIEENARGDLFVCALFAAFAAFAKNEGLAMFPVFAIVALVFSLRKTRKDVFIAFAIALAMLLPWLIYRRFLPHQHEDYGGRLLDLGTIFHNIARLRIILPRFVGEMLNFNYVSAIWLLLPVVALIGWRGFLRPGARAIWIVLIAQLAIYILAFIVTPLDLNEMIPKVSGRLLLHVMPIAAILIGLHAREVSSLKR